MTLKRGREGRDARPGGQFTAMVRPARAKRVTMAVKRMLGIKLESREKKRAAKRQRRPLCWTRYADHSLAYIPSSPVDLTLRVGVCSWARRVGIVQGCKTLNVPAGDIGASWNEDQGLAPRIEGHQQLESRSSLGLRRSLGVWGQWACVTIGVRSDERRVRS